MPTVYLVDPQRRPLAESVLIPFLVDRGNGNQGFQVRTAQFSWAELYEWRMKARALLGRPELRSLGISVPRNRVVIGLAPRAAPEGVLADLGTLGIKTDGVVFMETDFVPRTASLTDRRRPVMGGLQIDPTEGADGECTGGLVLKFTVTNDAGSSDTQITVTENQNAPECFM